VESEGARSPIADIRRMMIRMFSELKEYIQKQLNESEERTGK
jgi:hypothetical protein